VRLIARFMAACLLLVACDGGEQTLVVDVRTDLLPFEEFVGVRVVVTDPAGGMIAEVEHVPNVAEDFVSGVRVAELSIEAESVRLEGSLVGLSGSEFITRRVLTQLGSGNTGVTILITRDCVDVECSDSAAPACLGTQCVPEECSPENPELCGDGVCVVDADCESAVGCATGTCETGACVFRGDDESCGGGEFCHPEAGCQPSGPEDWWDSAWRRRLKLTFRNATRAENLVDFPMLALADPLAVSAVRFVDSDGTLLDYEVEDDRGGDQVVTWVRIPQIDASSDEDFIWVYWDNPDVSEVDVPEAVWSDSYDAVWHLSSALSDSTGNGWDLMDVGSTDAIGFHGRGRALDSATMAYLQTAADTSGIGGPSVTLSAWAFRTVGSAGYQAVVTRPSDARRSGNEFYLGYLRDAPIGLYTSVTEPESAEAAMASELMVWDHLVTTYDGSTIRIYLDGAEVGNAPFAGPLEEGAFRIFIGADSNSSGAPDVDFFDGVIDEVRIENTVRSAAWIDALHQDALRTLYSIGPTQR